MFMISNILKIALFKFINYYILISLFFCYLQLFRDLNKTKSKQLFGFFISNLVCYAAFLERWHCLLSDGPTGHFVVLLVRSLAFLSFFANFQTAESVFNLEDSKLLFFLILSIILLLWRTFIHTFLLPPFFLNA